MKAQIFELASQGELAWHIETLLRREFYPTIEIKHHVLDGEGQAAARQIGNLFLQLMKASTIAVGDFTIETEYEEGSWGYYWDAETDYLVRLAYDYRASVFPSVAVMNRMVMVPRDIHQAFDVPNDFSYLFRPLDLHGVILADFSEDEGVERAVRAVARQISSEIVMIGRRHMSLHGTRMPDFLELARLLEIKDNKYLPSLQPEIVRPLPHLQVRVVSGPLRLGRTSTVALEVQNNSGGPLGIVRVQIRRRRALPAPVGRYVDFTDAESEHQVVEFDMVPKAAPCCPIEVLFLFDEIGYDAIAPVPVFVDVVTG